jgi:hypothetical protein
VQPLRDLAASKTPYRGSALPAAKAAVTKLRGLLTDLLKAERDQAITLLDTHEAKLKTLEGFAGMDAPRQEQVLAATHSARSAVGTARFVTGIRDRVQRFTTQDYPAQLALAARLVVPEVKATAGASEKPAQPKPKVEYTPAASLRAECSLLYITNRTELDQWLAALRKAAEAELDKGNRITL